MINGVDHILIDYLTKLSYDEYYAYQYGHDIIELSLAPSKFANHRFGASIIVSLHGESDIGISVTMKNYYQDTSLTYHIMYNENKDKYPILLYLITSVLMRLPNSDMDSNLVTNIKLKLINDI